MAIYARLLANGVTSAAVPTAYIASPLGFSATTRGYYVMLLGAIRRAGIAPLDPWDDPDGATAAALAAAGGLGEAERVEALRALNARLSAANATALRTADGVLAILDGPDVDSGTAAEIGYASALGKPVVGLRLDSRRTGDNDGAAVNLQVEHFLAAPVRRTLPDAIDTLTSLLGGL